MAYLNRIKMRELTKEQKALIEEEVLATYTEHYVLFGGQIHGFRLGATKVLLNPEKYGLFSLKEILKGDDPAFTKEDGSQEFVDGINYILDKIRSHDR